ncbi:hypothetical protein [Helcococcus kunzii]|uniref:hypothetical protein n=1 Tax=Helcococcus kunzii TaxID=40091 RepID=UPI001BB02CBF|nr:hypothetical protein [Helcococcus kunzii]QUY65674.1 hypothetical protein GUI37_09135 [Helcococcus kunzii]
MRREYEKIQDEIEKSKLRIKHNLEQAPKEKIIDFLMKEIDNGNFRDKLDRYISDDYDYGDAKTYKETVKDIYYGNMRKGFIDWYAGGDLVDELNDYFDSEIEDLLKHNKNDLAFEMVYQTMYMLEKVEMDGSNGEHSMISSLCEETLKDILDNSTLEEKSKYFNRLEKFSKIEQNVGMTEDFFIDVLRYFNEDKFVPKKIEFFKKRIDEEAKNGFEYSLKIAIKELYIIYKENNLEKELIDLLDKWKKFEEIRIIYARYLYEKDEVDAALELLYEGENLIEDTFKRRKITKEIKEIYKKTGNDEALYNKIIEEQEKTNIVVYEDYIFVKDHKSEKWDTLKNRFIESLPKDEKYIKILYEENRIEDLLEQPTYLVKNVNYVWNFLKEKYPDLYLERYEESILQYMERANTRRMYNDNARELGNLAEISGGEIRAREIVNKLIEKYPRKTAMAEELNKALKRYFK